MNASALNDFLANHIAMCTGNPKVPNLPVAIAALQTLHDALATAIQKAANRGRQEMAERDAAMEEVSSALDKNASYVDIVSDDNLSTLLSTGFEQVSTNRAQSTLDAPAIVAVDQGQTGELKVRVGGDPNRRSLLGRIRPAGGSEFGPSISFASSRDIIFDGLVSGTKYVIQLCGVGGSTGQSDWAETGPAMAP